MIINKKGKFAAKTASLDILKKGKGFFLLEILVSFAILILFMYHIINSQKIMLLQTKHLESILQDTKTSLYKINENKKAVDDSEDK
jgi:hypothetical protein